MKMNAIIKPAREKGLELVQKEIPQIGFGGKRLSNRVIHNGQRNTVQYLCAHDENRYE